VTTCFMSTMLIAHIILMIRGIPNQSKRAQINIQRATNILSIQFSTFILFLLVPILILQSQALKVFEHFGPYPFLTAVAFFFCHGLFILIISLIMSRDHRLTIALFLGAKNTLVNVIA
ncbi:hypothetical protein PENTCL1PPCAC_19916, partial [Pristionchus entomophagus]